MSAKNFTKDDIRKVYRHLLGRESDDAAEEHHFNKCSSLADLLESVFLSPECQLRMERAKSQNEKLISEPTQKKTSKTKIMIRTFAEYDNFIREFEDSYNNKKSHAEGMSFLWAHELDFASFMKQFGFKSIPDPFSCDYIKQELAYFEYLSGRKYSHKNEGLFLDVSQSLKLLSPYAQGYEATTYYWKSVINLLHVMKPLCGERVVEMGSGTGNLVELFSRLNCRVTAVEANASCCDLIKARCSASTFAPKIYCESFNIIENDEDVFDYILFESSFHHCDDPVKLLEILSGKISKKGKIILFNEPILPSFSRPWGVVRPDGESALQIRQKGWIEYGFREDYLSELLQRTGWSNFQKHAFPDTQPIYTAIKI